MGSKNQVFHGNHSVRGPSGPRPHGAQKQACLMVHRCPWCMLDGSWLMAQVAMSHEPWAMGHELSSMHQVHRWLDANAESPGKRTSKHLLVNLGKTGSSWKTWFCWPHMATERVSTRQKCAGKWCATLWAPGLRFSWKIKKDARRKMIEIRQIKS